MHITFLVAALAAAASFSAAAAEAPAGPTAAAPIVILRDAIAYRKMMAAKPKVKPQAVPAPTAKPGARTVTTKKSPAADAHARWRTTGSSADAQDFLIQKIIADEEAARR